MATPPAWFNENYGYSNNSNRTYKKKSYTYRRRKKRTYYKTMIKVFLKGSLENATGATSRTGKYRTMLHKSSYGVHLSINVPVIRNGNVSMSNVPVNMQQASDKNGVEYWRGYLANHGIVTLFRCGGDYDFVVNVPIYVKKTV